MTKRTPSCIIISVTVIVTDKEVKRGEAVKRYSKQRETILNILHNTKSHPTAASIYEEARKTIPNISLGTVYRNLAELDSEGTIISLKVKDGSDHFDGNNFPHPHLYCRGCKKIIDLELPFAEDFINQCATMSGSEIDSHSLMFFGKCSGCKALG